MSVGVERGDFAACIAHRKAQGERAGTPEACDEELSCAFAVFKAQGCAEAVCALCAGKAGFALVAGRPSGAGLRVERGGKKAGKQNNKKTHE